jgi:hypothetical protein
MKLIYEHDEKKRIKMNQEEELMQNIMNASRDMEICLLTETMLMTKSGKYDFDFVYLKLEQFKERLIDLQNEEIA